MTKVISIANQKGGVGKSTTAQAIGAGLHLDGCRVLVIDLDPQGNLTYAAGAHSRGNTAYEVLTGQAKASEAIQETEQGHVIASDRNLVGLERELTTTGKEYRLKEAIAPLMGVYDYIIIDTPPALGILTVNALTASDSVIIAAQADIFSLQGVGQLYETIEAVRRYTNSALTIQGVLLTRHNPRTILSRDITEVTEDAAAKMGTFLYTATIRENTAVKEAQIEQRNLFLYDPKANGSIDYRAFIDEMKERGVL